MSDKGSSRGGISFLGLLTIVFITLKLLGVIHWSWWLVLAPLWAPVVLLPCALGLFVLLAYIADTLGLLRKKK